MRPAWLLLLAPLVLPSTAALEFASTFTLELPGGDATRVDAAVRGDDIHFVWTHAGAPATVRYGIVSAQGPTWRWQDAPPLGNLTPPPVGDFAQIAVLDATPVVVWQEQGASTQDIDLRLARFGADGSPQDAQMLHDDAGRQIVPRLACGTAACAAVWAEESGPNVGDWRVVGARVAPGVGPRVVLSDAASGAAADFPDVLALHGSTFLVAWTDRRDPAGQQIRATLWDANTGAVEESTRVSPANATGVRTSVALARNRTHILAAWVDAAQPSHRGLDAATSLDQGRSWAQVDAAAWTATGSDAQHPTAFARPDGALVVAWEDARWGLPQVALAEPDAQGAWQVAGVGVLAPEVRHSSAQALAMGADLHLLVLEQEGAARRAVVHSTAVGLQALASPTATLPQSSAGLGAWTVVVAAAVLILVRRR